MEIIKEGLFNQTAQFKGKCRMCETTVIYQLEDCYGNFKMIDKEPVAEVTCCVCGFRVWAELIKEA